MYTFYRISGTVGAGYKETAYFNPREFVWETGKMDTARYDIATLDEATSLLPVAQDRDVSNIEIETITFEVEE